MACRTAARRLAPSLAPARASPGAPPRPPPTRQAAALQPAAALPIALRDRLGVLIWIHLQFDGSRQFSRRRRTYALGQHWTQQPQTRMSRSANVGAFERRKTTVRTLPGPIASAQALRNHPESSSAPADRGGKLSKAIRSEGLCRHGQPNRGHRRASLREMVLAAPPPAPQEHGGSSQRTPTKFIEVHF